MDTNRETKMIKTSGGHEVVLKTYATGREVGVIQSVYAGAAKMKMVGKEVVLDGFDATVEERAIAKTIELLVVSLDGKTENIVERIGDLPYKEYDEVIAALGEISGKKKAEQ